jgi:hypothetical protein
MTAKVCPTMYCGVPKNLAAFSAMRPKVSLPNAPRIDLTSGCSELVGAVVVGFSELTGSLFSPR